MTVRTGRSRAPSAMLPLSYLILAAPALLLGTLGTVWLAPELAGHYYHPWVAALTHTVTLGWITLTIIGASYQIVPIVLGRPLWSERLARWQLVALVVGLVGLIAHFVIAAGSGLAWAAGVVAAAAIAHVVNTALTVRGMARWTFTSRLVAVGHTGLVLTLASGVLLAADRTWKFLPGAALDNVHAHVHVALLGWVLPMVIGVAARVYPMFLRSREPSGWPGALQLGGVIVGVPGVAIGLFVPSTPLVAAGALAAATAVAGHLVWMADVVRSRKRPLDWPLRLALTGTACLVPATVLGLALAFDLVGGPRVATAYAVVVLGGWASLTVAGMMLKIVPFLVWYRAYAPRAGRAPVPTLEALASPRLEAIAYALLVIGFAALTAAVATGHAGAIRGSAAVVAAGALAFAGAIVQVLSHLLYRSAATAHVRDGQAQAV